MFVDRRRPAGQVFTKADQPVVAWARIAVSYMPLASESARKRPAATPAATPGTGVLPGRTSRHGVLKIVGAVCQRLKLPKGPFAEGLDQLYLASASKIVKHLTSLG